MNKYKFAIQISTPVDEILKLDFVRSVRKCKGVTMYTEFGDPSYVEEWLEFELADGSIAKEGDWIVQDVCDHWYRMKDKKYQMHKDDQI